MSIRAQVCDEDILTILNNHEIFDRMASDSHVNELPTIDRENKTYLGYYINNKIVGLCIYVDYLDYSLIHFYVIKEFRRAVSFDFAVKSLRLSRFNRVVAMTPECYMSVINFEKKMGFKMIGIHKDKFIKNGVSNRFFVMELKK